MADTKQIVTELEKELDKLESRFNNVAGIIKDRILKKLSDIKDDTRNWLNEFEKGKDVGAKVAKKLDDLQKTSNKLFLDRIALEAALSKAQRTNNINLERRIRQHLYANRLAETEINNTQTVLYKLQQANEERKKQNDLLDIAKNKLKETFAPLKQTFTLASIFKLIIDGALRFNKISVDIGKNLGYGASNADRVTRNFVKIAQSADNINVTTKNIGEAFNELVEATGFAYEFSADQLETQIKLTKQVGLQAKDAAQIQRYGVLNSKSSEQTYQSFIKGLVATRNQLKVGINFKAALAEAANVSGQLAANLGFNPERIAKAVVTAKAFGLELEDLKNTTRTLLDFGSSIEKELDAELLTGKQLNLERARAAALSGDQVTLAEEIAKNVGTAADFAKMNVLQQDALAASVGMTSDKLAETLRKREEAIKSGKSLAQVTADETKQALERQNIQEKFNNAILKLQDLIGNLAAGPLGSVLTILTNSLDLISSIGVGLMTWYATSKLIAGSQMLIAWYSQQKLIADRLGVGVGNVVIAQLGRMLGISTAKAVAETTAATALSFGTLLPIILGAGAAIYSLISSFKGPSFAKGGIVTSEINNATIGEAGPEAIIPLNSPKANQMLGSKTDTSVLEGMMQNLITVTKESNNRQNIINMDGKKVGTTLTQNSYKLA